MVLEFDLNVQQFEVQPVQIDWSDSEGQPRRYTPDVLVEYRRDIVPAKNFRPMLCEVKYREDLREEWAEIRPKLKAGFKYAKQHGWRFKIFTEEEIRTPYLDNARFLLTYMRQELNEVHAELLLGRLSEMREADPNSLGSAVFRDRWARAELLPALWHLIANRRIGTDLGLPLTMFSRIWSKDIVR
ncbi:tnsA endonuclease C terminal family protein [Collimonas arenae]|uniref:TnsA endonuclease C terminal family protein n=2 Tax=Collimonas arenae TaxID=279058 RepID=A0A127PWE4_9BURK|nr:tnsA endonuclease C terminal family protein [Collimonas arenae]AMP12034.1 tnsA endonuclease C terminal family protein [Collimonas arenae]